MSSIKTEYGLINYKVQPDTLSGWSDLSIPSKKYVDDAVGIVAAGSVWELLSSGDLQAIPSVTGAILPSADDNSDLGSLSYRFKDLYLGSKIDASTYLDIWTNGSSRIYINSTGNVGIGTTTPNYRFEIVGSSNSTIQMIGDLTTNIATAVISSRALFGTTSNHDLGFITNASERLTISTNGYVGIGTNSPSVKLHVKGNSGLYIESDDVGYGSFKFVPYSTGQAYSNIKSSDNLELRFGSLGNAGKLGLLNTTNTSRFGINTATPNSTLDIIGEDDGDLSYGLTVRNSTSYTSLSVRDDGFIELNGSTPSPSYPDTNVKNAINNGTWHRGGLYIASDIENHSGNITSGEIRMGTGGSINFWAEYSNPADGQYTYGGRIYSSLQALQIRGGLLGTRILGGQTSTLGIHVDLGGKVGIMTDADVYYALKVKGTGGAGHVALFEPNASTDTIMIIKEDGSVGINTNTPLYKLDSRGSFNLQVGSDFYIRQVSLQIHAQTDANNYIRINRDNGGILDLNASVYASMAITSTGEAIGINTTAVSIRHNTAIFFRRTDSFAYGYWDTVNYRLKLGPLGISPTAPTDTLEVVGTFKLQDGTQGTDKVLVSDADGVASWQTVASYPPDNVTIGVNTAGELTLIGNTTGKYAETLTTPGSNVANTITHNLGTEDISVTLWLVTTDEMVSAKVSNRTLNSVDVTFSVAPGEDVRVVVIG